MFQGLSSRLTRISESMQGIGRLTEDNIQSSLREVRMALLEADVALPVVRSFVEEVKTKAAGTQVVKSISPGQAFIKVVNDALVELMGHENQALNLQSKPPVVILLAGLQGAGKTTTAAKLAVHIKAQHKKRVMLASCDVYRPAAIEQLKSLAEKIDTPFFDAQGDSKPLSIAKKAQEAAANSMSDVLIIDTAGRLHVDDEMMSEITSLHKAVDPTETLFVVDSMTGQDAANTAKAFNDALDLTGVILTKVDGDARGGAALSVNYITGKPIKFIGEGEKTDALSLFHPERIASRILGKGDVVSLVEEAQDNFDIAKSEKLAKKIKKGRGLDLTDLREQLTTMQNMGGMSAMMDKLPNMPGMNMAAMQKNVDEKQFTRMIAVIDSMTPAERKKPELLNGSRKRRISSGSGTQIQDINRLLKQHKQMGKMMKKMKGKGMEKLMSKFGGGMPSL